MGPKKKPRNSEIALIEDCKRRLNRSLSKGEWGEATSLLNQIGNQHRLLGQWEEAEENHEKEINYCRMHLKKVGRMGLGIAYRSMAEVYIDKGEVDKGVPYIRKYLECAQHSGNLVEEQRASITMGRAYLLKEELNEAEKWFRTAYGILKDPGLQESLKGDPKELMVMKCNNCQNIGVTLEAKGSDKQAIPWFLKAVEIGRKEGLLEYLHTCHLALYNIHLKMKEWKGALAQAEAGVKVAAKLQAGGGSSGGEANLLEVEAKIGLSKALFNCDEVEGGKKVLKRVWKILGRKKELGEFKEEVEGLLVPTVKLSRRLDELYTLTSGKEVPTSISTLSLKKISTLYEKIADHYAELNVFHLGVENYLKAAKYAVMVKDPPLPPKKLGSLYFSIAETFKDLGVKEKALEYYQKELECYEGQDMPDEKFKTQTHITTLLEKWKSVEETFSAHETAIALAFSTTSPKKKRRLLTANQNCGMFLKSVKDPRAVEYLKNAEEFKRELGTEDEEEEEDSQDLLGENDRDSDSSFVDLENLSSDAESDEEESTDLKNVAIANKKRLTKKRNEAGETPLHIAAKKGDLNSVRKYVRQGLDVNARDTAGWTPLHEAANFGCASVVEELLRHGAQVNDPGGSLCEGITPLHDALSNGHIQVARILLEHGANVLGRDKKRNFPIDHLIIWRNGLDRGDLTEEVHKEYREMKERLKDKMREKGRSYTTEDERRAYHQSSKRSNSPEFKVMGAADQGIPVRIAQDSFDPHNAEEATKEYRDTMRNLMKGKGTLDHGQGKKRRRRALSPGPRTALIPQDKDVHEDWLLPDDLSQVPNLPGPSTSRATEITRKRRRTNEKRRPKSRSPAPQEDSEDEELMDIDVNVSNDEDEEEQLSPVLVIRREDADIASSPERIEEDNMDDVSQRSFDLFTQDQVQQVHDSPSPVSFQDHERRSPGLNPPRPRRSSANSNNSRRSTPFIDSSDEDEECMVINEDASPSPRRRNITFKQQKLVKMINNKVKDASNSAARSKSKFSRTNSHSSLASSTTSNSRPSSTVALRLKVRIEEKVMLIPVSSEDKGKTVEWLGHEISSRYEKQFGCGKPILELYTKDEALLWTGDKIEEALAHENEEIIGKITKFEGGGPTSISGYEKICADLGCKPSPIIISALQHFQDTLGCLKITGIPISGKGMAPTLFRFLKGNGTLKKLSLEECCIYDGDLDELSAVLPTLPSLVELNLASNAITTKGVTTLSRKLLDHRDTNYPLTLLDLSFNLLDDSAASFILDCINLLKNLKELRLSYCYLTPAFFENLHLPEFQPGTGEEGFSSMDLDLIRSFFN